MVTHTLQCIYRKLSPSSNVPKLETEGSWLSSADTVISQCRKCLSRVEQFVIIFSMLLISSRIPKLEYWGVIFILCRHSDTSLLSVSWMGAHTLQCIYPMLSPSSNVLKLETEGSWLSSAETVISHCRRCLARVEQFVIIFFMLLIFPVYQTWSTETSFLILCRDSDK